ncbi:MAG: restriction endonuclease subunit S [Elusimicrobiota bacterium]
MAEKKLKPGWRWVKFGDVVRHCKEEEAPKSGDRYVAGEHMDTDDLKIRRWGTAGDGYLGPAFHRRFRSGQVLYGSRRTYLRKVAVADFDGICANTTYVLESKDPQILVPALLPFIMQTERFVKHSIKQSRGSVNPYINFSDIGWFKFALPPVDMQRKIAAVASELEDVCESYGIARSKLNAACAAFINDSFASFSKQHASQVAADVMEDITVGIVVKPADLYVPQGVGVRTLRSLNVFPHRFSLEEMIEISREAHRSHNKSALRAGDIVVVRTGRPGDAAVITKELQGVNCIDLIIARPGKSIAPYFVTAFLNSQFGRRMFMAGITGTAQKHFNIGEFTKLKIPIPPIEQQWRFVDQLRELENGLEKVSRRASNIQGVKRNMLEQILN